MIATGIAARAVIARSTNHAAGRAAPAPAVGGPWRARGEVAVEGDQVEQRLHHRRHSRARGRRSSLQALVVEEQLERLRVEHVGDGGHPQPRPVLGADPAWTLAPSATSSVASPWPATRSRRPRSGRRAPRRRPRARAPGGSSRSGSTTCSVSTPTRVSGASIQGNSGWPQAGQRPPGVAVSLMSTVARSAGTRIGIELRRGLGVLGLRLSVGPRFQ